MKISRPRESFPMLNLTSMLDMVFLLNIFFLVATTFSRGELEMEVKLPQADEVQSLLEPTGEIVVNVLKDGTMSVKGRTMDLSEIERLLREAGASNPDQPVIIRGDAEARHKAIVDIMNACVGAQITRVSIGVAPGSEPGP